ncbi:MAG: MATE family efflux transporter [Muribaculaceae bacterium]|nr:MATE family efflux transporter [Muribaculaceae bacterium]
MEGKNLTTGSVLNNIVYFSIPYLFSYFLQILYGLADLFVVGQFCGVSTITAVSIGSQIMHMLTVIIVGLAMGTTVVIAQAIGANDKKRTTQAVGNTITLFLVFSLVMAVVLLLSVGGIVSVMSTPVEAVAETKSYLTICFLGIPFIVAYNIIASIFRGLGDSKSPMYFIMIACAVNIILDYVLIGAYRMGASGAAIATVVSQTVSVIVALIFIKKHKSGLQVSRAELKPRKAVMGKILNIGVPVALQDGFIQIAFLVITIIANLRGLNDAAAVGIVEKIIGILFLIPSAMLSTVSAVAAQNLGAKKVDRAKKTLWEALAITVGFGMVFSIAIQFMAGDVVSIFTSESEVIRLGDQYLRGYVWDCVLAGMHFCFSGFFCACGWSILSFIHNVAAIIIARIPLAYLASVMFPDTLYPMGMATNTGSLLSVLICVGAYIWLNKQRKLDVFME